MKSRSHTVSFCVASALALTGMQTLRSQVVPATPEKFSTRGIGDRSTGSAIGFTPAKPQTITRTVTRIVLGAARQWKTTDGKSFSGKLIAFEDLVVETKLENGSKPAPQAPPPVPKHPTVVREGKARILVDAKPFEVPLERLGGEERKFIEEIRAALAAKK